MNLYRYSATIFTLLAAACSGTPTPEGAILIHSGERISIEPGVEVSYLCGIVEGVNLGSVAITQESGEQTYVTNCVEDFEVDLNGDGTADWLMKESGFALYAMPLGKHIDKNPGGKER